LKTKTIILVVIAFIVVMLVHEKQENIVIPKESIRIRIISNSNDGDDILEKLRVKKNVEQQLYSLLKGVDDVSVARNIINDNLDKLNVVIDNTTDEKFDVKFGNNYFPEKVYKGVIYDAGEYESIVITLGSGNGENFWCVLFPPLCLLDENETTKDVEYKFFVKELLNRYIVNQ